MIMYLKPARFLGLHRPRKTRVLQGLPGSYMAFQGLTRPSRVLRGLAEEEEEEEEEEEANRRQRFSQDLDLDECTEFNNATIEHRSEFRTL